MWLAWYYWLSHSTVYIPFLPALLDTNSNTGTKTLTLSNTGTKTLTKTKIYLDFIFYYSNFYYFSSFYVDLMNRGTLDTLSCMIDYIKKKKKESIKRKILHFMILLLKLSWSSNAGYHITLCFIACSFEATQWWNVFNACLLIRKITQKTTKLNFIKLWNCALQYKIEEHNQELIQFRCEAIVIPLKLTLVGHKLS